MFFGAVDAGGQLSEQLGGDGSCIDGMDFKQLAKFVQVTNLFGRELPHVRAAPWFDRDEAFGLQSIQRLTHRRFADSKLGRKRLLSQSGQLAESAIEQVLLNASIGKLSKIRDFRKLCHDLCRSRGFYTT